MKYTALVLSLLVFASCTPEDPPTPTPTPDPANVTLEFNHFYGTQPVQFNSWYTTNSGDSIRLTRLDYLLSNIYLVRSNGDTIFAEGRNNFMYVDATDASNTWDFGTGLTGDYVGIGFDLGLEDDINKGDPNQWPAGHPLNPVVNGLHWGWADGYAFTAIEGRYIKSDGNEAPIVLHVAFEKNRRQIFMAQSFSLTGNSIVEVDYSVDGLFETPTIYRPEQDGSFTHSADSDGGLSELISGNIAAAFEISNVHPE